MDGKSLNLTQELLQQLQTIIPQAFSEGKLDTTALKTLLGEDVFVQGERYGLSWAGKSDAYKVLQQQTTTTLIPEPEQSVDWDNAQHVFIEGENLEVLKLLQKSYFGQVKMIYIDPPYNTGSDSFIYPDKFSETKEEYLQRIGDKNDEGYMLRQGAFRPNRKESGQYHSNWLNMMLPRLYLARNLLREDGVIFVSINDYEVHDLILLMNDVFGEENKVATLVWDKNHSAQAGIFKVYHEYVLMYAKNISEIEVPNATNNEPFEAGAMKKVSSRHPLCEFTFPKGVRIEAKDGEEFVGKWGDAETVEVVSGRLRAHNKQTMDEVTLKAGFTQRNQMHAFFYGDRENLIVKSHDFIKWF